MRKPAFVAYAKTKTQISFAVTAKLICAFVFAIQIVQSLFYLTPKFQASSHLLWLYSPVCLGPGRKPRRPVCLEQGSNVLFCLCYNVAQMSQRILHEGSCINELNELRKKIKCKALLNILPFFCN